MKKILSLIAIFSLLSISVFAQNDLGKADDVDRVGIAPVISELSGDIPTSAHKMLLTKMKQIATKNGMAALPANPMFVMYPAVNVLSKETTPTAPPMQAITLEVSFFIADLASGNVYSETSIEVKGVGKSEARAYKQALKNINARKGQFKAFVEKGKEKIVEYYNSNCDMVLSTAKTLISQNKKKEALNYLLSVPGVCKECYDKCMVLAQSIDPELEAPVANNSEEKVGGKPAGSDEELENMETSSVLSVEINRNLVLKYVKTKIFGEKTFVSARIVNTGNEDIDISIWTGYFRVIDNNGNAYKCKRLKSGDRETGGWLEGTIIPEAPMNLELEFDGKVKSIRLFELNYKDNKYKIRNIPENTIK